MKPYRHVKLTDTEITTLEEGANNSRKAHFRVRCHCLLLSHRGYRINEIARIYEKKESTIRFWMDNWGQSGIAGLFIKKGRGLKGALSGIPEEAVEEIKKK